MHGSYSPLLLLLGLANGHPHVNVPDLADVLGEVGYVVEFGRPGVGVRFHQIQSMTMALARLGATFEANNPISHLMIDKIRGTLKEDLLNEKILSAIVEIKTKFDDVERVLSTVMEVANQIDTVVALGVSTRCDTDGQDPMLAPKLEALGYRFERAKTNMGLGRITNVVEGEDLGDEHLASVR